MYGVSGIPPEYILLSVGFTRCNLFLIMLITWNFIVFDIFLESGFIFIMSFDSFTYRQVTILAVFSSSNQVVTVDKNQN